MTEARRVLVVDDELPARQNLRLALAGCEGWVVVAEAADATAARECVRAQAIDLVFLDIQMPGENGIRFARWLANRPQPPIVIFATAYDSFAIEAFEAHAMDYLLKPFDDIRLRQALERAGSLIDLQQRAAYAVAVRDLADDQQARAAQQPPPRLQLLNIRSLRRIERVRMDDVVWISSAGNYVELHLAGRVLLHRATLGWMEARLDPQSFLRVHRTALVRREAVREFRSHAERGPHLLLANGDEVAMSPRGVARLRQWLGHPSEAGATWFPAPRR